MPAPKKYLIAYRTPRSSGRFFNTRLNGQPPTEADILSMEAELAEQHGEPVAILSLSELTLDDAQPDDGTLKA